MLCERGIRTLETSTRNTLDISAVPVIKGLSHLPIIVDPSHSGGKRELVIPLARAAVAAGIDALFIETHPDIEAAPCDGPSQISYEELDQLLAEVRSIDTAVRDAAIR